ncbi:hypothetical protein ACEPAH_3308 [Sanghuangporus vaninii]
MMVSLSRAHATIFILFYFLFRCVEAAINVKVDDEHGDEITGALPAYSPPTAWNSGEACSDCAVKPDPSQAYEGTWHISTRKLGNTSFTIEINVTGTAVYAYFILSNYVQGVPVKTNMSFLMDWNVVGAFEYDPGTSPDFVYNALGYSVTDLANTAHTFVINSVVDGPDDSVILFDRLIYTAEEDSITSSLASPGLTKSSSISSTEFLQNMSPSETGLPTLSAPQSTNTSTSTPASSNPAPTISSSKPSQVAVVGGSVAGGVAVLLVAAIALLCIRRRRREATVASALPFTSASKTKMPESTECGSIDERAVLPPTSDVRRTNAEPPLDQYPQLEKDPFQRDIFDEKQERLAARSRPSPGDRTASSSPWDTTMNGTRTNRATRTEHMLLEYIATLQAEVDRLQDRYSTAEISPPPSYGDAAGRPV